MKMKPWKSQLLEPQIKKNKPACVTCDQKSAMKNLVKNISQKSKLSSAEIIEAKCSEIERKDRSTSIKHVNQPVVNAPKKINLN